ncbi:MAG: SPOR domain-containing protein [Proteobacteria bacterium]|nr:SPOR domain-containing protein [Pseudomonadota bacterium]
MWGKTEEDRDFVVLLEGVISIEREGETYELDTPLSLFMAPRGQPVEPIGPVDGDDLAVWAQETEPQAGQGVNSMDGQHQLNLASFARETLAVDLVRRLAAAGYAARFERVSVDDRDWWRVGISGFDSVDDAAYAADALRETFSLVSPWISKSN